MQLYAWGGDRGLALRQFGTCVRQLADELQASPMAETVRLAEAIRNGTLSIPAAFRASMEGDHEAVLAPSSVATSLST